jgi:hypothetical protein
MRFFPAVLRSLPIRSIPFVDLHCAYSGTWLSVGRDSDESVEKGQERERGAFDERRADQRGEEARAFRGTGLRTW